MLSAQDNVTAWNVLRKITNNDSNICEHIWQQINYLTNQQGLEDVYIYSYVCGVWGDVCVCRDVCEICVCCVYMNEICAWGVLRANGECRTILDIAVYFKG